MPIFRLSKPQPSELVSDNDPLDPVVTDEIYNRYQETVEEGYPDVPLHIGARRPHASASGVDTFYGMDRAQPSESMDSDDEGGHRGLVGRDAVRQGITELREEGIQEDAYKRTRVNTNAAGDWVAATFFVDNTQSVLIAPDRDNRGDTVITNWSTNDVYLSRDQTPDVSSGPSGNAVRIPANGSRTLRCQTMIWCRGTTSTKQWVDVQEEVG